MPLKNWTKSLFYRGCHAGNYHSLLLNRIKKNDYIPILSLHRVSPQPNHFWPPLTPALFNDLLGFLKKHFDIVTLHEIEKHKGQKPKLVLSFDDGYYDFIEYAMPILRKHGITVNHNIIPSQLSGERPLWNIALYDFLQAAPVSLLKEIRFTGFDASHFIGKPDYKIRLGLQASKMLKKLSYTERDNIIHHLEQTVFSQCQPYPETRMIRLHEMHDLLAHHEIGVHSYSHNNMGNESMAYFIEDFKKCQAFFNTHPFPALDIYAFPNGSYRAEQIAYLEQNGVTHILLVDDHYATHRSPYRRFNIAGFSLYEVVFQALGIKAKKEFNVYRPD